MNVVDALRNTDKGRIVYDRYCFQEGRAKVVLEDISKLLCSLSISPHCTSSSKDDQSSSFSISQSVSGDSDDGSIIFSSPVKKKEIDESFNVNLLAKQASEEALLLKYEERRKQKAKELLLKRQADVEEFHLDNAKSTENQFQCILDKYKTESINNFIELQKLCEKEVEEVKEREKALRNNQEIHAQRLKLKEAEIKQKKIEEEQLRIRKGIREKKKKQEQQNQWLQELMHNQEQIAALIKEMQIKLASCPNLEHLTISCNEVKLNIEQFMTSYDQILLSIRERTITPEDLLSAQILFQNFKKLHQEVIQDIAQATIKQFAEKEIQEKSTLKVLREADKDANVDVLDKPVESNFVEKVKKESVNKLSAYIDTNSLEEYTKIMENQINVQKSYEDLVVNPEFKKYKFDLQKAVNSPINAISSYSGHHLRDKIERLESLLLGRTIEVAGKQISTRHHPMALDYCKDLIAKKLVAQGEGQVASKFDTAFPIALIIVFIWSKFPDVGNLILAHFYTRCPYLVPFYIARKENQSQEDHYRSLGYIYIDGVIEKQDKFLKRMSGIMRLYAAVIQTLIPPKFKYTHPHSIKHGWMWLSKVLNLEPRPDITATLLFDFLEVSGHSLRKAYGKQYVKLLHALCKDYFPKIKNVTGSGCGGPVVRLEDFLQKVIVTGNIAPPEGSLSLHFLSSI